MNGIKIPFKQLTRKIVTFLLITLTLITIQTGVSAGNVVRKEETVGGGPGINFDTPLIFNNGIVYLNFTNLPTSANSARFVRNEALDSHITYSPYLPQNFVLAPGESLADNYTLLESDLKTGGAVIFGCWAVIYNGSATVRLESSVIEKGEEAPGFLVIGSLLAITLIATLNKIAIKKNENMRKS